MLNLLRTLPLLLVRLLSSVLILAHNLLVASMEAEHALSEALGGYSSRLHLRDESDDVLGIIPPVPFSVF